MTKGRWEDAGHRGQLGGQEGLGGCAQGRPSAVPTLDAAGAGEGEKALLLSAGLEASASLSAEGKASFLGGHVCAAGRKQELPGPPHAKASVFRGRRQGDWGPSWCSVVREPSPLRDGPRPQRQESGLLHKMSAAITITRHLVSIYYYYSELKSRRRFRSARLALRVGGQRLPRLCDTHRTKTRS